MSQVVSIGPAMNLVDEVLTHLVAAGNDYSCTVVVFPGKRPAHVLRKRIADRTGKSFVPPRIFSIDALVQSVYDSVSGAGRPDLSKLDAVAILHEIHLRSPERVGGERFRELDLFLPFGLRVFADLEELAMASVPHERVESAFSGIAFRSLHVLGSMYREFYAEVERRGYVSRAMRYQLVGERIDLEAIGRPDRIVLAGFFALTVAEQNILHRLLALDQTVMVFQQGRGLEERLKALHLRPDTKQGDEPERTVRLYSASDTHGEILGLTRKLSECLESSGLDERTVIVVPDPEALPPLIHQSLAMIAEDNHNISLGYPHARTPVFGFLSALMDLAGSMNSNRFFAPDYLKFVLHPYTKNILLDGGAHVTRVLFHAIEDLFMEGEIPTFFSLEDLENKQALFERAAAADGSMDPGRVQAHLGDIHRFTIRAVLGSGTVGELARRCSEVLSYIAANSTGRHHLLFRPYLESLLDSLYEVERSLIARESSTDIAALSRILRRCISEGNVPFPGTPLKGLQVLGFLETRNLQFNRVFVLDVNEGVMPGESGRYTLIPNRTRSILGLPTNRERDQIVAYYFDLLLKGAKETHLFFIENDEKAASRYVEEIIWDAQKRQGEARRENLVTQVRYKATLSHSLPPPVAKTIEMVGTIKRMKFSTKRLDTYLQCGLKFYYAYVLRLEEREEVTGDVDRLGLGRLVHEALTRFYTPLLNRTLTEEMFDSRRMDDIVERLFEEHYGGVLVQNKFLLRSQVKRQLRAFLENYQVPALRERPVKLLALEQDVQVSRKGWSLGGRIDRIEERGDTIAILDYKTGGTPARYKVRFDKLDIDDRTTWAGAIGTLQLEMYHLLYGMANERNMDTILPAYVMLGLGRIDKDIEIGLADDTTSKSEAASALEAVIDGLFRELADPSIPFAMTSEPPKDCPECPFTTLCGTQWVKGKGRG